MADPIDTALLGRRHRFDGPAGQPDMPFLMNGLGVTTSRQVKLAMLADLDPAGSETRAMLAKLRHDLLGFAGATGEHSVVVVHGTILQALESVVTSIVPSRRKKVMVLSSGVEAEMLARLLERHGRLVERADALGPTATMADMVAATLDADADIAQVWLVHCDGATGRVQPLADIAKVVHARGRMMIVDASLTFGGMDIDLARDGIDVLVAGSGQCCESAPGLGVVFARRSLLVQAEGKSPTAANDLHALWNLQESPSAGFVTLPAANLLAAFSQALQELRSEGGPRARLARYRNLAGEVMIGMQSMGFAPVLPAHDAGPIMQVFHTLRDSHFQVDEFRVRLLGKGYVIGGTGNVAIGTTGHIDVVVIQRLIQAINMVLSEMGNPEARPDAERR